LFLVKGDHFLILVHNTKNAINFLCFFNFVSTTLCRLNRHANEVLEGVQRIEPSDDFMQAADLENSSSQPDRSKYFPLRIQPNSGYFGTADERGQDATQRATSAPAASARSSASLANSTSAAAAPSAPASAAPAPALVPTCDAATFNKRARAALTPEALAGCLASTVTGGTAAVSKWVKQKRESNVMYLAGSSAAAEPAAAREENVGHIVRSVNELLRLFWKAMTSTNLDLARADDLRSKAVKLAARVEEIKESNRAGSAGKLLQPVMESLQCAMNHHDKLVIRLKHRIM
jgi:hypothetical protein